MKELIDFIKSNKGYIRTKEVKKKGFHTRKINELLKKGVIYRVKPGLYRLSDMSGADHISLIDVCMAYPKGIICMLSAADYYELTTYAPWRIDVSIPHGYRNRKIEYPPVKVFHFREKSYGLGIEEISTKNGNFRIYNREKTVCDVFRLINISGEETAVKILKNYLRWSKYNTVKLRKYMEELNVEKKIVPIMKGLINS